MLQNVADKTKSTIIRKKCPFCSKTAQQISQSIDGNEVTIKLECGHSIVEYTLVNDPNWKCQSISGKEPFKFQYETLDFLVKCNFRGGVFHETGVGKTLCSLLPIKKFPSQMIPFAVICKASLKAQWFQEILDWTGLPAQIIDSGNDKPYPELFKCFIISFDTVKNLNWIDKIGLKYIIIDECQQIKNSAAKRTQALRAVIKDIPNVVALSGTPIKNHAGEYFPVLNILRPEVFHSQAAFERDFLDTYYTGWTYKIGGIAHRQAERFKELTKDWIIRYTRDEVLPDLPKIFRKNYFIELGEEVENAYKRAYLEFRDEYLNQGENQNGNRFGDTGNLIAKLNRLRHITGISKVLPISEFVNEFLEDCDRKIVLFVHHKDVGTGLFNNIKRITDKMGIDGPLQLTSEMSNTDAGTDADKKFKNDPNARVMIASTLSAGEGKNWQMCSDAIICERQWNPANEEQAEGRFPRPGSIADSISITYALALGTPDEYLAEVVEHKRHIFQNTMKNEQMVWSQPEVLKEMCELLISKGGKRWSL